MLLRPQRLKVLYRRSEEQTPKTQLREVTLQEENVVYERAISNCESEIREKIQEADLLKRKLMQMDENERNLSYDFENAQTASDNASRSGQSDESIGDLKTTVETENDVEALKKAILEKLEERKKELVINLVQPVADKMSLYICFCRFLLR